jgi:hypothetical protein
VIAKTKIRMHGLQQRASGERDALQRSFIVALCQKPPLASPSHPIGQKRAKLAPTCLDDVQTYPECALSCFMAII